MFHFWQPLITTAMTTLSSKIINVHKKQMAKIAVDAVMAVANLERNDVNFDMIKVACAACARALVRLCLLLVRHTYFSCGCCHVVVVTILFSCSLVLSTHRHMFLYSVGTKKLESFLGGRIQL